MECNRCGEVDDVFEREVFRTTEYLCSECADERDEELVEKYLERDLKVRRGEIDVEEPVDLDEKLDAIDPYEDAAGLR